MWEHWNKPHKMLVQTVLYHKIYFWIKDYIIKYSGKSNPFAQK